MPGLVSTPADPPAKLIRDEQGRPFIVVREWVLRAA